MCIQGSVGKRGRNQPADVIVIKVLLNGAWRHLPDAPLPINGHIDNATRARILFFQTRVMGLAKPDGQVGRSGATLKALRALMSPNFDAAKLRGIMPQASQELIGLYYKHLVTEMETRAINTPLRRAHFLAQLAHESGSLRYNAEIASGAAYEGRKDLGNSEKGDGKRFKGRGLIQLTGRSNYVAYGEDIDVDLVTDGAWALVATDPALAVGAAGWFWDKHGLNTVADADNIRKLTRRINGGVNGLADRTRFLVRAKWFLLP